MKVPEDLDETIRWVARSFAPAIATNRRELRRRAEAAATRWGPESAEALAARLHGEPSPPADVPQHLTRLGAWIEARQFAIIEVLECFGADALPVLRRIAHGEYDWSQGNAIEILCRLAARGIETEVIGGEVSTLLREVRDEAVDYAMGPLLLRAKKDAQLPTFLERYASVDLGVTVQTTEEGGCEVSVDGSRRDVG